MVFPMISMPKQTGAHGRDMGSGETPEKTAEIGQKAIKSKCRKGAEKPFSEAKRGENDKTD